MCLNLRNKSSCPLTITLYALCLTTYNVTIPSAILNATLSDLRTKI